MFISLTKKDKWVIAVDYVVILLSYSGAVQNYSARFGRVVILV